MGNEIFKIYFLLLSYYVPLEYDIVLYLNNQKFISPMDLCKMYGSNWPRGSGFKKNRQNILFYVVIISPWNMACPLILKPKDDLWQVWLIFVGCRCEEDL